MGTRIDRRKLVKGAGAAAGLAVAGRGMPVGAADGRRLPVVGGRYQTPKPGGTLNVATTTEATGLDPDSVKVEGCLIGICMGETWRRVQPATRRSAKASKG